METQFNVNQKNGLEKLKSLQNLNFINKNLFLTIMEKHICSIDQATQLFNLGVIERSWFYWGCFFAEKYALCTIDNDIVISELFNNSGKKIIYPAYTSAELGELLPTSGWNQERVSNGFKLILKDNYGKESTVFAQKEVDARAKMLIYLLKNGFKKDKNPLNVSQ